MNTSTRTYTPAEELPAAPVTPKRRETPAELHSARSSQDGEVQPYWDVSKSISYLAHHHSQLDKSTDLLQAIVNVVANHPVSDSLDQSSPSGSNKTVICTRKDAIPTPPTQAQSRIISDASTLPVSLRTRASDSCLVARCRVNSGIHASNTSEQPQKSLEDLLQHFLSLKLKDEKAWNLLVKTRETAHLNEITALKHKHAKGFKELEDAQAVTQQGLARADRSKTYLQKQVKKIHAAKEDAQKACQTTQDQLAQQQATYQEVVAAFQGEVLDQKAAEENCGTLETQLTTLQAQYEARENALVQENCRLQREVSTQDQLAQQQNQFLARDNASSLENRRLLGVISDMQLRTYKLEFEMMKHQACITPEQYAQTQDALKGQLAAAKREVDETRDKINELTYAMEGTPTENMVGQAQLIEARTKQVQELSAEVIELTTQLADLHNEKVRREAEIKISSETGVKEVARAASVKEILEKKVEILRTANEELMAYPRAVLRNSETDLVEAVSIGVEALRNERSSLDANLQKTTIALESAEEDLALWRFRHHSLSEEMTAKNEKIADLESQNIKLDSETGRLDIELSAMTHEKDAVIKEKDQVIAGLEEVTRDFNELVYQEADARTAWLLQTQAAQLKKLQEDFQVERSVVAGIEWEEMKRRNRDKLDDALGYHQNQMFRQTAAELHDCQNELRQSYHARDESRQECQRLKAKVLLLTGMKDRERSGVALRNAFAQSLEQPANHNPGFSVPSPSSESASSVQTVLRHTETIADVDAQYFRGRDSCFIADLRKAVEESDRQLAETIQNEEYQTLGSSNSLLTALPVCIPSEEAFVYAGSPPSSVSSQVSLPIPIPRNAPSNPRPTSINGWFREPLGNNNFYNHYDQWLAGKGKARMVEGSTAPISHEHLTDEEFRCLRSEGIAAARDANRDCELDDGPQYHYDLSKAEAEVCEIHTLEDIYSMLWSEQPSEGEEGHTASGSSLWVGQGEEEWKDAEVLKDGDGSPYAEFMFDESPAKE